MPAPYKKTLIASSLAALLLAACNGDDANNSPTPIIGTFMDATVDGLEYTSGGAKRLTGALGDFSCLPGENVTFSIGGLALGAATCATTITPLSLTANTGVRDERVVNRLVALQLLDDDADPSNGIRIAFDVRSALATRTLDFSASAATFNTAMNAILASLPEPYKSRTVDDNRRMLAREHFENALNTTLGAPAPETVTQTAGVGAVTATITRYQMQAAASFYIPYEGASANVRADFPLGFLPSYGSALAFKGVNATGDLEFYGLTDRGPNGDGPNVPALPGGSTAAKIFPAPSFTPSIGVITVSKSGATLTSVMPIKAAAGVNSSGLTPPEGTLGNSGDVPVLDTMKFDTNTKAVFNANGLDTESIALDKKRNALWISDEYGPFIVKVDVATGVVLAKYAPGSGLPTLFAKRRANRGMEGMALDVAADKLHGFLQSPLTDGNAFYSVTNSQQRVERFAKFTRWIEFDPNTGTTTRTFAYPLTAADYQDGRTGNAKLGDMVALGNGKFVVIEQGAAPSGKVFNKLMLVEIGNATDIGAAAFNPATSDLEKSSMAAAAVNGANWANVVALKKTLLLDLNAAGWLAEKAEGLTLVDGSTLALANDNDFGLRTGIFTPNGQMVGGADVTACNVDAAGNIVANSSLGCAAGNSIRVTRGDDKERPSRLWLIKFSQPLANYSVPN